MTQVPPPLPPEQQRIMEYSRSSTGVREIAFRQRILLLCILVYLLAVLGQFALPAELRPFLGLVLLPVIVTASVFVFMLAIKIYGTAVGITLGILTLIPCIGLIALLVVNAKATTLLRGAGMKVGLLGATVPDSYVG